MTSAVENIKEKLDLITSRMKKPKTAVITAGMPYANGPVHIGHLAGAHVPADIYARFMRMMIGEENVLFVCGTDDHGSNSEVAAKKKGLTTEDFIAQVHSAQKKTMDSYGISLDAYTGTSRPENYEEHVKLCQDFLRDLHSNGRLEKRTSDQWYDPEFTMFLPDRFVSGTCPKCEAPGAYSEECDTCGATYEAHELKDPVSSVSGKTPELKPTDHWFLDMFAATDELKAWLEEKKKTWRKNILTEVLATVAPTLAFSNKSEPTFKELKDKLPAHKSKYAAGRKVAVSFENLEDFKKGQIILSEAGIICEVSDGWAYRSITRDVSWGIPVPAEIDESMKGKTLYVWPESLIAPISFTKVALKNKGLDPEDYKKFWCQKESGIYQFLGQDNVFFYVLMQGAMWIGAKKDPKGLPQEGDIQLSDIFSSYHLQINGQKMSKSKGNFFTGDELLQRYDADQIRYFLSILSLTEKNSNFDEDHLKERNAFLAGPLNAAFEKPISAIHSKFGSVIPEGKLIGKTEKETLKIIPNYYKMMQKGEYAKILFAVENYARVINSLFSQYKPHDDRHDETERRDALFSCFYILKNLVIMLHPFAPETIDRLRDSLNLPANVYSLNNLGVPMDPGSKIGDKQEYFKGA